MRRSFVSPPLTHSSAFAIAALLACVANVSAFNPPQDKAGPLTVRIVAPETVTQVAAPLEVQVTIENRGDEPVSGTIRLGLIDGWRAEPADAVPFTVAAKSRAENRFRVTVAPGSYSAHYPIHAYATFAWQGQSHTAHPILILETKLPARPNAATPLAWEPLPLTGDRTLALLQVPVRRAVVAVFDRPPQTMPTGWTGAAEGNRGSLNFQNGQRLGDVARDVLAIHPPWFDGQVGTAWLEYPLTLPQAAPIKLRFATAVTPTGEGDGVSFRVRVAALDAPEGQAGTVVFERHSAAKTWEDGEADLTAFAGQAIRLQLESHPGPAKNTAFDQSYWAEPTLVLGQPQPVPIAYPPAKFDGDWRLGQVAVGESKYEVRLWPGQRGLLDATVGFLTAQRQLYFRGFQVRVLGMRVDNPGAPVTLMEAKPQPQPSGSYEIRHRFQSPRGAFDLVGRVELKDNALRIGFRLENGPPAQPWLAARIEELAVDQFSHAAQRVFAGHGNVIQDPGAFTLGFDGHRLATSHVGFEFANGMSLVQAVDLPPSRLDVEPAAKHYSLHTAQNATFTFIPGENVWEAARAYREVNGLRAAGGVQKLAGRFVFDLWGGRYGESDAALQRAFRYGLTDAAVVWHNWQRWGYDYRLPEIYPPNPGLGSEDQLKTMIESCRAAGVLFALHDNYIDMYPDAGGFSYEREIAFHADGRPVRAWLNEGRGAQSYRYRADRVAAYLQPNLQTIKKQLDPTAYFIDVWSSAPPYDYWTADGRFVDGVQTRDSWGQHFAWIRDLLGDGAPQISESGHDQLIGWLDGAQTNHLRVGPNLPGDHSWSVWNIPCKDAERTPWFDVAHHDRFILHGAGYSTRYQAGLDGRLHGIYSDDYLATEVLTGHPTMVSQPFGRDVVRKYWLSQDLMRALALRTIESVEFAGGDLHRQHVGWSGGGQVWVNRGKQDWPIEGTSSVLPQYGFLARVPTAAGLVTAAVSRREGLIVETASSPDQLYVNARQPATAGPRIQPTAGSVTSADGRRIELVIDWQADDPVPDGYQPFLHFVDAKGEIAFQATYDADRFRQQKSGRIEMPATASVPDTSKPGDTLELRVGLYRPSGGGPRLPLLGVNDGDGRIRLGTVELIGAASHVGGIRWTPQTPVADAYAARQNPAGKLVDFGPVRTAGGGRLVRQDQSLQLIPLPDSGAVRTRFEIRWDRLPWQLPRPTHIEAQAEDGRVLWRAPIGTSGLVIECEPDMFAYRLLAE